MDSNDERLGLPRDAKARDKIVFFLKTMGPLTASQLALELRITTIAVRQHLQALETQDVVTHSLKKGKVGRPAHVWSLAPASLSHFPDRHRELTLSLLEAVKRVHGREGLRQVVADWTGRNAAAWGARCGGDDVLAERVQRLVAVRREDGYMADIEHSPDGSIHLVENHCPIEKAACECVDLCEGELKAFSTILGEGVTIERSEHIASGDRRCVYRITETPKPSPDGHASA